MFPNGGDSASSHGAEWGFDGEARLTWLDWQVDGSELVLRGRLVRSPFLLVRTVALRDDRLTITDTVTNVGAEHVDVMWGQQVAFGNALIILAGAGQAVTFLLAFCSTIWVGWVLLAAPSILREAESAGFAPKVVLASTHRSVLRRVPLELLQAHAMPGRTTSRP